MTKLPELYPGHQHQWAELSEWTEDLTSACPPSMVRCTVCAFEAPRNAAGLDGHMTEPVCGCGHGWREHDPIGRCLAYTKKSHPTYSISKGCGCRDYSPQPAKEPA